jgi:MFS family permease
VILVAFVFHQARVANPMMPLSLFESRNYSSINFATLGIYFALGGAPFFVPMFLQNVLDQSPTVSGAVLLPMPIMLFLFAQKFGLLAAKHGSRWIIFAGATVCVVGQLMMVSVVDPFDSGFVSLKDLRNPTHLSQKAFLKRDRLGLDGGVSLGITVACPYPAKLVGSDCVNTLELTFWENTSLILRQTGLFIAASSVIGFGLAMLVAPLTAVVLSSLPESKSGVGTAVNYVAAKVAGLFAVAGLGVVFSSVFTASLDSRLAKVSSNPNPQANLEAFKANPTARAEPDFLWVRGAQTEAFKMVMVVCAGLTLVGGVAALYVREDVLVESDSSLN